MLMMIWNIGGMVLDMMTMNKIPVSNGGVLYKGPPIPYALFMNRWYTLEVA